jgi:hypothetical protein
VRHHRILPPWWRKHFLAAEFGVAIAVTGGIAIWVYKLGGSSDVTKLLDQNRATVYGALASIFGSLLGFVITTLSIIVVLASMERLVIVRESAHYRTLYRTFIAGIRAIGLATIVALVALVGDRDTAPVRSLFIAMVFAATLAVLRLARAIWILEKVIGLIVGPNKARASRRA